MDPVRNPFAPGAGQRPPELAGRDRELDAFEIVLERVARGRPERSLVLTGLRGVGKTVLLGELRSMAVRAGLGRGQDRGAAGRRPAPPALRRAAPGDPRPRRAAPRRPTASTRCSASSRRSRQRSLAGRRQAARPLAARHRRRRPQRPRRLRRHRDRPRRAVHRGRRRWPRTSARRRDPHRRDAGPPPRRRLGALRGVPRAVAVAARRSWSSARACRTCPRCSRRRSPTPSGSSATSRIGQLDRKDADFALLAPAEREDATFDADALDALYDASGGYPYFVQAYGKAAGTPRCAARSPPPTSRWPRRRPRRSWPSASSGRATSGPPRPSASTCGPWPS